MRLFLDDMRKPPFGWDRVLTADDCIATLLSRHVEELSLDHDLDEEHYDTSRDPSTYRHKTGMAVVDWLCGAKPSAWPAVVSVHSLNSTARKAMVEKLTRRAPPGVRIVDAPRIT